MNSTKLEKILNDNNISKVYEYPSSSKVIYQENKVNRYFDKYGILMGFISKDDYIGKPINDIIVYMNKQGDIIYTGEYLGFGFSKFNSGICAVASRPRKYKFINIKGEYISDLEFDINIRSSTSKMFSRFKDETNNAIIRIDGKYGVINKSGKILGEGIIYDLIVSPNPGDDTYKLIRNGISQFMDINGNILFNEKYGKSSLFTNDIAIVSIGKKFSYLNKNGKFINDKKYNKVGRFTEEGYAKCSRGNREYYINKDGMEFDTLEIEIK